MPPPPDPTDLSPADRAGELARLLAAAVRRLNPPVPPPILAPQNLPESSPNGLAAGPDRSVTVHAG